MRKKKRGANKFLKIVLMVFMLLVSSTLVYAWSYYKGGSGKNPNHITYDISGNQVYWGYEYYKYQIGKTSSTVSHPFTHTYIENEYLDNNEKLKIFADDIPLYTGDECQNIKCPILQQGYFCGEEGLVSSEEVTDGASKVALARDDSKGRDCEGISFGLPSGSLGFSFNKDIAYQYPLPLTCSKYRLEVTNLKGWNDAGCTPPNPCIHEFDSTDQATHTFGAGTKDQVTFTLTLDENRLNGVEMYFEDKSSGDGSISWTLSCIRECPSQWIDEGQKGSYTVVGGSDGCCGDDETDWGYVAQLPGQGLVSGFYAICNTKNNEWFWEVANTNPYIIYTNNQRENTLYDYLSNSENWYACNAENNVYNFNLPSNLIPLGGNPPAPQFTSTIETDTQSTEGQRYDSQSVETQIIGIGEVGKEDIRLLPQTIDVECDPSDSIWGNDENDGNQYFCVDGSDGRYYQCTAEDNYRKSPNCNEAHCGSEHDCSGMEAGKESCTLDCRYDVNRMSVLSHESFLCYSENSQSLFAECSGNLRDNKNEGKTYRQGERLHTLSEFFCPENNCVLAMRLRADVLEPEYRVFIAGEGEFILTSAEGFKITDWSDYDFIEFYIYYTINTNFNIALYSTADYSNPNVGLLYQTSIIDNSLTGDDLGKWHYIRIDLNEARNAGNDLSNVRFMKLSVAKADVRSDEIIFNSNRYHNIIYFDRMYLVNENENIPLYCSNEAKWVSGDDIDTRRYLCGEQPGHKWTGSKCCGNDFEESYNDPANDYACWKGQGIANDQLQEVDIKSIGIYCKTREGSCNAGETPVLSLSSLTNAHGAKSGYNNVVCCKSREGTLNTRDGQILTLSDSTNAHAAKNGYGNPVDLQLSGWTGKMLSCELKPGAGGIDTGYDFCDTEGYNTCVVSLSATTNAHLESCDKSNYNYRLCCKITQ